MTRASSICDVLKRNVGGSNPAKFPSRQSLRCGYVDAKCTDRYYDFMQGKFETERTSSARLDAVVLDAHSLSRCRNFESDCGKPRRNAPTFSGMARDTAENILTKG